MALYLLQASKLKLNCFHTFCLLVAFHTCCSNCRSVQKSLHYPLVFIVSESHRGGANSSNLFSKELVAKIDIHTIRYVSIPFKVPRPLNSN